METICRLHHPGRMSIGLELPLDNDWSLEGDRKRREEGRPFGVPDMSRHSELAKQADRLGFNTLWVREVPLYDPAFGDGAQLFHTLSYLGYLSGITENALIGTAAIVLPLHNPLVLAKAMATIENISHSRLIMGVGLGDRAIEFPILDAEFEGRDATLRKNFEIVNEAWKTEHQLNTYNPHVSERLQVYPKPKKKIPWVLAGRAQQSIEWISRNMDGWFNYPRTVDQTKQMVRFYKDALYDYEQPEKPYITAIHLNILKDKDAPFTPSRFGGSIGINHVNDLMLAYQKAGVAHMAVNLRKSETPLPEALEQLAETVLPQFKNGMAECLPK